MPPSSGSSGRPAAEPEELEREETPAGSVSGGSSRGSSATTDFFEHEGPEFEPGQAGEEERPAAFTVRPGEQQVLDVDWDPRVVRSTLEAIGQVAHTAAGKGDQDWLFIKRELDAISTPLARILSRYPATQAASGIGDEFAVLIGLSGYTLRSVKERKAAIEHAERQQAYQDAAERRGPPPPASMGVPGEPEFDDPTTMMEGGGADGWLTRKDPAGS